MSYDKSAQSYKNFESTVFQETQDMVRSTFSMVADFESNKFLFPALAGADSNHTEMPLIFSDDKVLLNKYFNDLFRYKIVISGQTTQIKIRVRKAENLLTYFKRKYHFE
jgi:hypothetical protein